MNQHEFQVEAIDRLARIETKQDMTNGRVTKVEIEVEKLKLAQAERRGAGRLAMGASSAAGAALGALVQYFFHR